MSEEVEYLREHLKEICQYKGLQEELTYDVPLEILKRTCIALDYLQQENKQLKSSIGSLEIALKERTEERDKHSFKEHLCKKVIEKANDELITLIQIIMEQPSKNVEEDNYLLSRLESISNILVGGNNE